MCTYSKSMRIESKGDLKSKLIFILVIMPINKAIKLT
ncbi:MAG: hypothetical protein AMQ22_00189 [Candidatus Methanofastidiosum methylothiophilum]|uniref:Uncharacterized protein n=1 Tax=Candidatus Methanofastidiosum methylothiophilum TaxID=1705564 RepID=A0A150J8W2_9EURY|nr:MAG: hypothetical protein AMQ22_00189 [Candidatus Methanofastidiosum methylthiophilus]